MSERGTVVIDRGVFDHPLFKGPFSRRDAWLWLISEAAWKNTRVYIGGEIIELQRGQLAHSQRFMAKCWRWTRDRVRWFLQQLEQLKMIDSKTTPGHGIITICNYNVYQVEPTSNTPATPQQPPKVKDSKNPDSDSSAVCARELADELYTIFGFAPDFVPPAWMGLTHWLEAGLRGGWKSDLVRLAARKVAARRKGTPPTNFRYLGPAIVDEHALAAAPPPRSTVHNLGKGANGKRTVQDAARELAERLAGESAEHEQRTLNLLRSFDGG